MSRITEIPSDAESIEPGPALPDVTVSQDGRSTRWDDHRAARRAELVRLARRAVHRFGPDVSMDDIAATAETSKSVVYRYFTDKTGLQLAVGEAVHAQMHAALTKAARAATSPRDELRSMIDVYLEMLEASPNVYWFVTRPVGDADAAPLGNFLGRVAVLIARPFSRAMAEAGLRETALADVWAAGAVGFVRGAGEWWLRHGGRFDSPSRAELTERVTAWLWAGPVHHPGHHRAGAPPAQPYEVPVPAGVVGPLGDPPAEVPAVPPASGPAETGPPTQATPSSVTSPISVTEEPS